MSHVTEGQRYTIEKMVEQGYRQKDIAEVIGKDKSVVSREIKRNSDQRNGNYRSVLAQRKYESRKQEKPKAIRFTEEVKAYVEAKLEKKWSPEQISSTMTQECGHKVSHERIYQHIIEDKKKGGLLHKNLRRRRKYKKRIGASDYRGKIKDQKSINDRPVDVEEKTRIGDFEVDLVLGASLIFIFTIFKQNWFFKNKISEKQRFKGSSKGNCTSIKAIQKPPTYNNFR